jgi:hypothetical protein
MTPEESRTHYLESIFTLDEVAYLHTINLAQRYLAGEISIDTVYKEFKEGGI